MIFLTLIRILLIDFFSDHPNCNEIDSLIGYDFPIEEYNINYYPILITTKIFSHKFVFAETESKDILKRHCLWQSDARKWVIGFCENIEKNVSQYYLTQNSECPVGTSRSQLSSIISKSEFKWKDSENDTHVKGGLLKKVNRIALGNRVDSGDQITATGLFFSNQPERIKRVKKCREWIKIPIVNRWMCRMEEKEIDLENNVIPEGSNNINEDIFENEFDQDIFDDEYYEDIFGIELDEDIFENEINEEIFGNELLCIVEETSTKEQKSCVFPFFLKNDGKTYFECTNDFDPDQRYWCSTKVSKQQLG